MLSIKTTPTTRTLTDSTVSASPKFAKLGVHLIMHETSSSRRMSRTYSSGMENMLVLDGFSQQMRSR